jgi:DNA-binding PadR family transcriptional regulator
MGQARREDIRDNLTLELRRGALVLAVLSVLQDEQYGYSLKTYLADKDIQIDEGTLYPLLRRLEAQSLLDSRWALGDNRPRRYYKLNAQGMKTLKELKGEWGQIAGALDKLLKNSDGREGEARHGPDRSVRSRSGAAPSRE